ncbi:MAG: electron transport complex subunit RsxA [Oscillospiraceae bacterium]|nr:electron transport complex subunit RsxA [Oscillospiraceae bacterium]
MSILGIISVALGALLSDNIVFAHYLGIAPFVSKTESLKSALVTGISITLMTGICTIATSILENLVLVPFDIIYLRSVAYVVVVAMSVTVLSAAFKKYAKRLKDIPLSLPLVFSNSAVLGVCLFAAKSGYNLLEAVFYGIFAGVGFTLSAMLFAAVRERLKYSKVPKFFEGIPIILITAGLISLAFMGFDGMKFI